MTGNQVAIAVLVAEKLIRELDEDYVGLWKVPWHIRRAWPEASDDQVRSLATSILTALMTSDVAIRQLSGLISLLRA